MGPITKRALVIAASFLVLAGTFVRADASEVMKMNVPFPFMVRGTTLPAGHYLLQRDDSDPAVLLIRGEKGTRTGLYVLTSPTSAHDPAGNKPVVTFNRVENDYKLSNVWESGTEGRTVVTR
jgi:hypothetical protein